MKPNEWIIEGDVGVSSRTIWAVMTGIVAKPRQCDRHYDTPSDPDDFSRCYKLLCLFPEWKARLPKVAKIFTKWMPYIREWDKLCEMYRQWVIDLEKYRSERRLHPRKAKPKPEDYTLTKPNRYQITNRITNQTYQASAFSADEACRKLGWLIGDCYVQEIGRG